jgi:hypothetical protein
VDHGTSNDSAVPGVPCFGHAVGLRALRRLSGNLIDQIYFTYSEAGASPRLAKIAGDGTQALC